MRDLIDAVVVERPRLQNAPVKAVVCQARYPQLLDFGDEQVGPIQRALGSRYPLVEREVAEELAVDAVPNPDSFLRRTGSVHRMYRFHDKEKSWTATVGPESMSLETTNYVGMKDFLTRWWELADAARDAFSLNVQLRLGLRYINEVACPGSARRDDLEGWVNRDLVGVIGSHDSRTADVIRCLAEARFRQPDDRICGIRWGVAPDPDTPNQMLFLLDLDYSDPETRDFDLEEQVTALAAFNAGAYDLFEWAFPPETRAQFGPELDPGGSNA